MIWVCVIAMLMVALFLLLWPLWRRVDMAPLDSNTANVAVLKEQLAELDIDLENGNLTAGQYQQARQNLELSVAADLTRDEAVHQLSSGGRKILSVVSFFLIPLCSVLLYQQVTTYQGIPAQGHDSVQKAAEKAVDEKLPPVIQMVEVLAERLRNNPDNAEGWQMLGRSYMILNRLDDAARAYGRAYGLMGDSNPHLIADYAEVLALLNDNQLQGKPLELVDQALTLQPDMPKGLWLKGFSYYQKNDYASAIMHWQKVLATPEVGEDARHTLQVYIADAESKMVVNSGRFRPVPAAATPISLSVYVSLDDDIKRKVPSDTAVFVFARAVSGSPRPLAVKKLQVSELPVAVVLDDSMAMMQGHSLSSHKQVIAGARVSFSGSPISQMGDIEGLTGPLSLSGQSEAHVVIRNVIN